MINIVCKIASYFSCCDRLLLSLLILSACLYSCTDATKTSYISNKPEWKVGYWVWRGYGDEGTDGSGRQGQLFDMLYVQVGESHINKSSQRPNQLHIWWPKKLPKAKAYYAVWRCTGSGCIDDHVVADLLKSYQSIKTEAKNAGQQVAGLQIDYDCPTPELLQYARFLQNVRGSLPKEELLSITALLDWFRPKTKIAEVIRWTDEFVPQFYDNDPKNIGSDTTGSAEVIDPSKWAPVFNAFRKPYRIGISSFGRIIETHAGDKGCSWPQQSGASVVQRESLLEIMAKEKISLVRTDTSSAGETIITYKSNGYNNGGNDFSCPGEKLKMVVPTRQSVSNAYNAAKAMGGNCSGVVFFRLPGSNQALALTRHEVESIISGVDAVSAMTTVEVEDGLCATVSCNDLYIRLQERFPAQDVTLIVRSSTALDYFVPSRFGLAALRGPKTIEVRIPAYVGSPRISIGRAVSIGQAKFSVEGKKQ